MDLLTVLTSVSVMGVMIGLGIVTAYQVSVTRELKQGLMFIILNIAVPSIVLNGVFHTVISPRLLHQVFLVFVVSLLYNASSLLLAWTLAKKFFRESFYARKMAVVSAFGNTGFIGIPLCAAIFGPTGGLLAAVFDSALDLILFTFVVSILQAGEHFRFSHLKALINVPLAAVVAGLFFAAAGYQAPLFIRQLTSMLSGMAAPLAMLYIGLLMAPLLQNKKSLLYKEIWFPLSFRLLLMPVLVLFVIRYTYLDEMLKNIVIIQASMPTFTLVTVLFARYAKDEDAAVKTVVWSTLFSLVTIPFIVFLSAL